MTDPNVDKIVFYYRDGTRKGDLVSFQKDSITIGRAMDSDMRFNSGVDKGVSNHHAVVRFQNHCYELTDTHSSNGTYINGVRNERAILRTGDIIHFSALGPEIEVSIASDSNDHTMLDMHALDLQPKGKSQPTSPDLTNPSINEKAMRIRHFRFIRNTMMLALGTGAGMAGFSWTLIEGLGLSSAGQYFKAILCLIAGGILATLLFSIYHGRPGRQRVKPTEIVWMTLVTVFSLGGAFYALGGY